MFESGLALRGGLPRRWYRRHGHNSSIKWQLNCQGEERPSLRYIFIFLLFAGCAKPRSPLAPTEGPATASRASCVAKFNSTQLCLDIVWEKSPTLVDGEYTPGQVLVKVFRPNLADQSPVASEVSGDLSTFLWMSSMGHGSTPIELKKLDIGTYRGYPLVFSMPGVWDLNFEVKQGASVVDRASWTITL